MQDNALMQRVQRGDRAAFELIVRDYQPVVYGFLRARTTQVLDAEDLTQEVFLRLYVNRKEFSIDQPLRPWLMGIARNSLREFVRTHRRRKEVAWTEMCLELDDMVRDEQGDNDEALQHLPYCIDSLGQSAREAIRLRYASNLRLSQIGEKLRRSEGAVKLLMFRARQALKHCLTGKSQNGSHD